ncbi:hypothetical protein [Lysobacter gummosus]|uniref:hypothetical protein n=1 Tax=Lysobacter gummosus TaxID=262324 RepID=UPI0036394E62
MTNGGGGPAAPQPEPATAEKSAFHRHTPADGRIETRARRARQGAARQAVASREPRTGFRAGPGAAAADRDRAIIAVPGQCCRGQTSQVSGYGRPCSGSVRERGWCWCGAVFVSSLAAVSPRVAFGGGARHRWRERWRHRAGVSGQARCWPRGGPRATMAA